MIIEARGDILKISGALTENHWSTIVSVVNFLLRNHPQGIIIDCSELDETSSRGLQTFASALDYIRRKRSRIIFVNLPEKVLEELRAFPGLRSQLPIAKSIDEAQQSLELA